MWSSFRTSIFLVFCNGFLYVNYSHFVFIFLNFSLWVFCWYIFGCWVLPSYLLWIEFMTYIHIYIGYLFIYVSCHRILVSFANHLGETSLSRLVCQWYFGLRLTFFFFFACSLSSTILVLPLQGLVSLFWRWSGSC